MTAQWLTGNKNVLVLFSVILLRYLILASIAFTIYYVVKKRSWFARKIQQRFPARIDYWREIVFSIITSLIFTLIGYIVFISPLSRYTQAYYDIHAHSILYFVGTIFLMIVIHDTYFYWTHRWMHSKGIFPWFHKVHHLSTNPSPWAAFAFHPLEAVIEGSVIAVFAFLFPVHPLAIGIFLLFMMAYNVYGHLGYELYPKGFSKSMVGKWINTSVNHNMHHQHFHGNYGLYFLWWDRWMGTLQPTYDARFEEVKSRGDQTMIDSSNTKSADLGTVNTSRTL
ncbi:sterol desaturase family protein [Ohtaekwangia sp.]|uniref:sterol desaturase family protein n=1 Tax=Ohtaekwangia sp. TaxID=2066019 RepID=UPI002FDCA65E